MAQPRTSGVAQNEARIGASARVVGRVTGDGNLVVEGQVKGDIAVRGDLTIDSGASVVSNVDAYAVTISGSLEGDVNASGAVAVRSGARVKGDLHGTEVTLDEGADFAGRLDCEFTLPPELEGTSARR